jgi:hypothetical protein
MEELEPRSWLVKLTMTEALTLGKKENGHIFLKERL